MKRNDPRRLQKQRRRILEAAARFIARNGYHGMTMRGLAKATSSSPATAYNYFSSKEEILFALQKEAFESLIGAAQRALEAVRPPSERLFVFILNHISYFTFHADVMRVLVHEAGSLPPAKRNTIRKLKKTYFEIGRGVIEQVLEEGAQQIVSEQPGRNPADPVEIERITYSLFGMLNWIYSWYEPKHHGDPLEVARTMRHLILYGAVKSCPAIDSEHDLETHLEITEALPLVGSADPKKRKAS
jgi:AcrR family transcriptional regulator